MEHNRMEEFQRERERLNQLVMEYAGTNIKRFFNLDWQVYTDGALSKKTKELIGLVSSLTLRCDDCVMYHLVRCYEEGVRDDELEEALAIGLVVGGSITIPHLRKAFQAWHDLKDRKDSSQKPRE